MQTEYSAENLDLISRNSCTDGYTLSPRALIKATDWCGVCSGRAWRANSHGSPSSRKSASSKRFTGTQRFRIRRTSGFTGLRCLEHEHEHAEIQPLPDKEASSQMRSAQSVAHTYILRPTKRLYYCVVQHPEQSHASICCTSRIHRNLNLLQITYACSQVLLPGSWLTEICDRTNTRLPMFMLPTAVQSL